ncbi:taste receptor type 2 member 41-like [Ctenodactylus gundi]
MRLAWTTFFISLFTLLCALGILANGFMVLVLSKEWLKRGRLPPSDMILFGLGASRFFQQGLGMMFNYFYFFCFTEFSIGFIRLFVSLFWEFLNGTTFWFGTWLSVVFCVKIANFSHPAFLWLKWRLPRLVPRLLLGSVLISFTITLLFFWGNYAVYQAVKKYPNISHKEWNKRMETYYFMPLKLITMSIPCSLFLVSILSLISSLSIHSLRMRNSAHSPQEGSSIHIHARALKSLVSFLILYALSFVTLVVDAAVFITTDSKWFWPWQIIIYLCMSIHPFILINSNLKLRGLLRQVILLARGFLGGLSGTIS